MALLGGMEDVAAELCSNLVAELRYVDSQYATLLPEMGTAFGRACGDPVPYIKRLTVIITTCYLLGAWGRRRASRHHKGSSAGKSTSAMKSSVQLHSHPMAGSWQLLPQTVSCHS